MVKMRKALVFLACFAGVLCGRAEMYDLVIYGVDLRAIVLQLH